MRLRLALAVLSALVIACSPNGGSSVDTVAESVALDSIWNEAREPTDVLLELHQRGGFVQTADLAERVPLLVLYADGTLVGGERLEGVSPKLRRLNRVTLSADDKARIDALVSAIGLHDIDAEFDDSLIGQVYDAATIEIMYRDLDGRAHSYSVYGLNGPNNMPTPATQALGDVLGEFGSMSWRSNGEPVEPTLLQLYMFPGRSAGSGQPTEWPLPMSPDQFSSLGPGDSTCLHLTGDAAVATAEILWEIKLRKVFRTDDGNVYVAAKQLLPHEPTCGPEISGFDP